MLAMLSLGAAELEKQDEKWTSLHTTRWKRQPRCVATWNDDVPTQSKTRGSTLTPEYSESRETQTKFCETPLLSPSSRSFASLAFLSYRSRTELDRSADIASISLPRNSSGVLLEVFVHYFLPFFLTLPFTSKWPNQPSARRSSHRSSIAAQSKAAANQPWKVLLLGISGRLWSREKRVHSRSTTLWETQRSVEQCAPLKNVSLATLSNSG